MSGGPVAARLAEALRLVVATVKGTRARGGALLAAGVAFYALVSMAPFVVAAVAIAGAIFGGETVRGELHARIAHEVGTTVADFLGGLAADARDVTDISVASLASFAFLLWASSKLFLGVGTALQAVWEIPLPTHPKLELGHAVSLRERVWHWLWVRIKARLAALFGTIAAIGALLALLGSRIVLDVVSGYLDQPSFLSVSMSIWRVLEPVVAFAVLTCMVMGVYRLLASRRPSARAMWRGAMATAALLVAGRSLLALYLAHTTSASAYGAAGAAIVFLAWAYASAIVFLYGARFAFELDRARAGAPGSSKPS